MSRIDDLIREHCPDGVEYHPLRAVAEYSTRRIAAAALDPSDFVGVDNLLANRGGKRPPNHAPNTSQLTAFQAGDVLLGNIRPYLKKVWLAAHGGGCSGDVLAVTRRAPYIELLMPEFLYLVLSSDSFFDYNTATSKGAKMPRGDKTAILEYRVPIPPMNVQREIVGILDTFSELETELEAELQARRRQYADFRQRLLAPTTSQVPWVELRKIGRVLMCKRVFKEQTSPTGDVPFFKIGTFGAAADSYIPEGLYLDYRARYPFPRRGEVLLSAAGTVGRTVEYDGMPAYFQDSNIVWLDNDESLILNRYLFHQYQIMDWSTDGGTIKRLYNENLLRAIIPSPPRTEQERVIEILDAFEALVNDLSIGLPAELVARRKQYEYYRDKLLTFEEAR